MAVGIGEGGQEEKVLETSVGETFTIRLWEDRTRGEIYVPSYDPETLADRKSTRLNSSHIQKSRMPSSA